MQLMPKKNFITQTSTIAKKKNPPNLLVLVVISDLFSGIFVLSICLSQPSCLLTLLGTQDCHQQGNQKSLHGPCTLRAGTMWEGTSQ